MCATVNSLPRFKCRACQAENPLVKEMLGMGKQKERLWLCRQCKQANDPKRKVCTQCFTQRVMTGTKEPVIALEKTNVERVLRCGKCGTQTASESATCPKCFSCKLIS